MGYSVKEQLKEAEYEDILTVAEAGVPWEMLENKTVLITGAGGFIPSYLILAMLLQNDLHGRGITALGMVRNKERAEKKYGDLLKREDFSLVVQDVCEPFQIKEKADYVIHAASQASAWHFENDPVGTIRANLTGTEQALSYARRCGSATLFLSSLKVYGEVTDGSKRLKESQAGYLDHADYKNCYAVGKRAAETLCASYCKQYGMDVKIARPAYIYGPAALDDDRVWAQFIANIVRGQDILLKSNGAAYRSFCYVTDTAAALLLILLKGRGAEPYNVADENSNTTIRDFAKTAAAAFPEKGISLSFLHKEDEEEPSGETGKTPEILDHARLDGLGFTAQVSLKEGIMRAVRIAQEREKG